MADIRQAASWMGEGKKVTRPGWGPGTYYEGTRISLYMPDREPTFVLYFFTFDLLADDWEIYEG